MARVVYVVFLLSAGIIATLSSPFPQSGEDKEESGSNNNNNWNNQVSGVNCTQLQQQCNDNNNNLQNGASQNNQFANQTNGTPIQIQNNNVTNPCTPQAMQLCQMNQINQINQSPIMINQTNFNMITPPPAQFNPQQMQTAIPIPGGR